MKTQRILSAVITCIWIFVSCSHSQSERLENIKCIENYSIEVTGDHMQIYGGDCRSISAFVEERNCMLAYNHMLHRIDIIDLDNKKPFKHIPLKKEGPDGVNGISGLALFNNTVILQANNVFCQINMDGQVLSRCTIEQLLKPFPGFSTMVPDAQMYLNLYNSLSFDEVNGTIAFVIYSHQKEDSEYPKKAIMLSCIDWKIKDVIDIHYPQNLKEEEKLGMLGRVNVLPHGDSLIYNFPASSDIYIYNRKRQSVETYSAEVSYTQPLYSYPDEGNDLTTGYYFPIRYDSRKKIFWRIQQRPVDGNGIWGKPFSIAQLSSDFKVVNEYVLPAEKHVAPVPLFTDKAIFFPYVGGEFFTENNMVFYGLEYL
ncbi:MAG: DUF4221 family protein [Bacteroides sp.]|nr:DUF4221 family protein [Bacteroides sp.]